MRPDDDPADPVSRAMALIRERGGRATGARRAVLEELIRADGALLPAETLAVHVRDRHPGVNESTVYRTLELLEELGLAGHVHLGHGPAQWYLSGAQSRWYLTCTRCGGAVDGDPNWLLQLAADVADRTGFVIDLGHFAVTGLCAACRSPGRLDV